MSPLQAKSEKSVLPQSIWFAEGCFLCCGWHPFVSSRVGMDLTLSRHSVSSSTWVIRKLSTCESVSSFQKSLWRGCHMLLRPLYSDNYNEGLYNFSEILWFFVPLFKLESLGRSVEPLPDMSTIVRMSCCTTAACPGLTEGSSENLEIYSLTLEC